ncbi:MAG: glycerol-3-phosphate 1-O-acyltransferase PlsY [Bacteroidetes bacterium]|nr:glycerol-3-phosphate 1-O-acyltransferase PlsY [Bacteroidota bacterium]
MVLFVGLLIAAYLLGSIPTAVWIGRLFYSTDVRDFGSKSSGATNAIRVLGIKAGIPVLVIDILKGLAAVLMAGIMTKQAAFGVYEDYQVIFGFAAVLGHIFPIFAGFNGGKGVATLLGVLIAVHPMAALVTMGFFFLMFFITGFVSLSSITAATMYPIVMIFLFKVELISVAIFSLLVMMIIPLTHQKNIDRLLKGEEKRLEIRKRRDRLK